MLRWTRAVKGEAVFRTLGALCRSAIVVILALPVKLSPEKYLVWSTKHRLIASRADEMQDLGWAAGVVGESPMAQCLPKIQAYMSVCASQQV